MPMNIATKRLWIPSPRKNTHRCDKQVKWKVVVLSRVKASEMDQLFFPTSPRWLALFSLLVYGRSLISGFSIYWAGSESTLLSPRGHISCFFENLLTTPPQNIWRDKRSHPLRSSGKIFVSAFGYRRQSHPNWHGNLFAPTLLVKRPGTRCDTQTIFPK